MSKVKVKGGRGNVPYREKTIWKYRAIPKTLDDEISEIVEADHYPEGRWHSKDHFIVEKLKEAIAMERARRGEKDESAGRTA